LLEVGTGFHPELTGRENIFLNGAILGMKRREIELKFDEIVAFAETEKFLDTPVKRYSSGMYMRLAFAVAAHLEPEILLVDEVLAVGDAAFQKKCLGKMGEVARQGRTVLFVSHNMGAVLQLCSRAMVLTGGRCVLDGDVSTAVSAYLSEARSTDNAATFDTEPDKDVQIISMSVSSLDGESLSTHPYTEPFCLLISYRVKHWKVGSYVCVDVFNEADMRLLWSSDVTSVDDMMVERPAGVYEARVIVPGMVLAPGRYYFTAAIYAPGRSAFDARDRAVSVEITDSGSLLSNFGIKPHAATMIPLSWETTKEKEVGRRA
jgi:lipopolysaccharide transport system ATP-binding protein